MYKGLIFSLFDGSGKAVKDWADAGYQCICFNYDDADHGDYQSVRIIHDNIFYVNVWIDERFYHRAQQSFLKRTARIILVGPKLAENHLAQR